ncbi:hypothetical protein [Xanthocytophaga agilis]|uniref:Uncharacterized protein n=1 Tax=Xanthocytophaga agilis TaxID=3048010 RepID=A0AAE3QYS0_9BACT|nr:hypothetical protein [Xanthocytophaga agilis]MDJ1500511.1 hypothetical protein [Xanthocytophaga agilis]
MSEIRACKKCTIEMSESEESSFCNTCKCATWFEQLSGEQQAEVDSLIFTNQNLKAIVLTKDTLQIGLRNAVDLLDWRFNVLKESSRDKFEIDPDTYCKGLEGGLSEDDGTDSPTIIYSKSGRRSITLNL